MCVHISQININVFISCFISKTYFNFTDFKITIYFFNDKFKKRKKMKKEGFEEEYALDLISLHQYNLHSLLQFLQATGQCLTSCLTLVRALEDNAYLKRRCWYYFSFFTYIKVHQKFLVLNSLILHCHFQNAHSCLIVSF